MSFSPLFIGAHASTQHCRHSVQLLQLFQSPLHRGTCFNSNSATRRPCFQGRFSPLFIGAHASTPRPGGRQSRQLAFQSPLHRGTCFNKRCREHFLPGCSKFQSPLHRGTCFNDFTRKPSHRQHRSFSPLFIGAHASTRKGREVGIAHNMVSVPSSSGHMLQLHRLRVRRFQRSQFQSPLHRGTCFNLTAYRDSLGIWTMFQSPLHRGTCFNHESGTLVVTKLSVSVPSSSGHMLQLHPEIAAKGL